MPLPCTGNLSLLGPSQAAKPKQAMILRMSTEALDAMQQLNAELKFDFGENPVRPPSIASLFFLTCLLGAARWQCFLPSPHAARNISS